jgi:hypothetical protein
MCVYDVLEKCFHLPAHKNNGGESQKPVKSDSKNQAVGQNAHNRTSFSKALKK